MDYANLSRMTRLLPYVVLVALVGRAAAQPAAPEPPVVPAPTEPTPPPVEPPPIVDPSPPVVEPSADDPQEKKKKKKNKKTKKNQFSPYKRARLSGFFQPFFRYTLHTNDPTEDPNVDPPNVRIQRLRIALDGDLLPWLSYKVSIDPRSPELVGLLRDAYFDVTKVVPHHKIRVGQQKTQFGYENNESSSDLFYVNRAEISDALGRGTNLRDLGIGLIGRVKLGSGLRLEDAITVVNGAGLNVQDDNNRRKNVFGRVGLRYKPKNADYWIRFGISGARGDILDPGDDLLDPSDDFTEKFARVGADLEIDTKWLFAAAEVMLGRETIAGESEDLAGWYVNLVGKTPYPVGPLVRVDTFADDFRRFTFGAYYGAPAARFRMLLNYEFRQLKDGVRGDDRIFLWSQVRF